MGFIYLLLAISTLTVFFAILTSILTIWFRNKAMRIISFILSILAFIVYIILLVTLGNADEIFGISTDKLSFLPIAIPLFAMLFCHAKCYQNTLKKNVF